MQTKQQTNHNNRNEPNANTWTCVIRATSIPYNVAKINAANLKTISAWRWTCWMPKIVLIFLFLFVVRPLHKPFICFHFRAKFWFWFTCRIAALLTVCHLNSLNKNLHNADKKRASLDRRLFFVCWFHCFIMIWCPGHIRQERAAQDV